MTQCELDQIDQADYLAVGDYWKHPNVILGHQSLYFVEVCLPVHVNRGSTLELLRLRLEQIDAFFSQ